MSIVLERHLSKNKKEKEKMTPAGTFALGLSDSMSNYFGTGGAQTRRVAKEGLGALQVCWALLSVLPVR